jgi:hypothetical protein
MRTEWAVCVCFVYHVRSHYGHQERYIRMKKPPPLVPHDAIRKAFKSIQSGDLQLQIIDILGFTISPLLHWSIVSEIRNLHDSHYS